MQTRVRSTNILLHSWNKSGNNFTESWTPGRLVDDVFSVLNAGVTNGDHKSPYPIQFSHSYSKYCVGRSVTSNGYNENGWEGPSSQPVLPISASATFDNNVYNHALSDLYDAIRGNIDLTVDLAEASQTVHMVRAVRNLTCYLRTFHPKQWANKWLEYQYGWKPLVQDLYGAAQEVNRVLPSHLRIVKQAHHAYNLGIVISPGRIGFGREIRSEYYNNRVRFDTKWQIKPSVLTTLGNFGSLNPVSMAWELLPYSFVVDWMIDIGGYLRNLETAIVYANQFKSGYVTEGVKRVYQNTLSGYKTNPDGSQSYYALAGTAWDTQKKRTVLGSIPYPRVPRFEAHLGWQRIVSAASLVSQRVVLPKDRGRYDQRTSSQGGNTYNWKDMENWWRHR